ncbi:MAG: hypothetical protein WC760_10385 [Bacteroidia bacterium]
MFSFRSYVLVMAGVLMLQLALAGTPDGKYREKYANGKVKVTGYYKNDSKHKVWMYYDEYGRMTLKEKWKMGTLLWKAEYEEGRLSRTIDKDGKVLERPKCGCN